MTDCDGVGENVKSSELFQKDLQISLPVQVLWKNWPLKQCVCTCELEDVV